MCMIEMRRSRLTEAQKKRLLEFIGRMAQMRFRGDTQTVSEQREQLENLAAAARALQIAVNKLNAVAVSTLNAEARFLVRGKEPPHPLPASVLATLRAREHHLGVAGHGGLLDTAFDWAAALEVAADYAGDQLQPSKTSKPTEMRARELVTLLAQHVKDETGALPPKDRASWFAGVVECLGRHMGLTIGARLVVSGIEATH